MSADWSPVASLFKNGEPPSFVTMNTGTFASFDLSIFINRFCCIPLSGFNAGAATSCAAAGRAKSGLLPNRPAAHTASVVATPRARRAAALLASPPATGSGWCSSVLPDNGCSEAKIAGAR
jgi:hypothetical protein